MKKIGIITINDYNNYGNRLQSYATQEVLKYLGYECEEILNSPIDINNMADRIRRLRNKPLSELLIIICTKTIKTLQKFRQRIYRTKKERKIELEEQKLNILQSTRVSNFKQFSDENILSTSFVITPYNIPTDIGDRYDAFIVGSDQVWNPNFRYGSPIDFLTFAPKHKRISYSASFGISEIPKEFVNNYRHWLSDMEYISVREDSGAEIVKKLTNKNAKVLVDPTLMLTKEQWKLVSRTVASKPDKPYLLTYFLGEIAAENKEQINSIAKEYNLEIINLGDVGNERSYVADPADFLDYIDSSEIFLTDSFHGAVFSIIFEKPFIVFDRISKIPSMNSRINTLLMKFDLMERSAKNINNTSNIFDIDFTRVTPKLKLERKKAIDFLTNALNVED